MIMVNEKYYIFFYFLSLLFLITVVIVYKNSKIIKKIVTFIIIIVLCLHMYIVYDTYPSIEHYETNDQGLTDIQQNLTKLYSTMNSASKLSPDTSVNLNNEYLRTTRLAGEQSNSLYGNQSKPILNIVNKASNKTYNDLNSLPKNPYYLNSFSQSEIENIITNTSQNYINALEVIVDRTNPIK